MTLKTIINICVTALIFAITPLTAISAPITYYDLDFEGGTLGGGIGAFGSLPTNIASSNLDGRALQFDLVSQIQWNLNGLDSTTHRVAFDYYAEQGANITQFFDVPSILRLDVGATGRHHIDVYYDLTAKTAMSYIDGVLDNSLFYTQAWPSLPFGRDMRIANQADGPGNSTGIFQIDNFLWQGNVSMPTLVPEPATLALFGTGLLGIFFVRRRQSKYKL